MASNSKLNSSSTTRTPKPARKLKLLKLKASVFGSSRAETVSSRLTTLASAPMRDSEEEEGSRSWLPLVAALFCRVAKDMEMPMLALK